MKRRALLASLAALACAPRVLPPATPTRAAGVDTILGALSLEDRVGQLMTIAFRGRTITSHTERMIREKKVGGVILFKENFDDAASLRRLIDDLSRIASEAKALPLFFPIDQEGGSVVRIARGATVLPGQMSLAATPDPLASVRRAARIAADELRSFGVNWQLAPVADVNTEPRNPIIGNRSFGSDPQRVATLVAEAVRSYADAGLLTCVKHFPGHGATTVDSHSGLPEIAHDRARLDRVELVPFRSAIAAGAPAIMTAHIRVPVLDPTPDRPATLSPAIVDTLLRRDLRFAGLCLTDDLEMGALERSGGEARAALAAIAAGADHALLRFDESAHLEAHRLLLDAARSGSLPAARLETAVRRVLTAKERGGILAPGPRPAPDVAAGRAAALDLARSAITLLRNDRVLPLRGRVLAISPTHADLARIEEQSPPLHEALAAAYRTTTGLALERTTVAAAVAAARDADVCVVGTADAITNDGQAELVRALAAMKPTVLVALRSPYDVLVAPDVAVYVCAYDGREPAVRATVEVLLGQRRPSGRLPVDVPGAFTLGSGILDIR